MTKERTIFRKSGLEKSTKKKRSRHQFLDIDERDDALVVYIHRDETNFIKTPTPASSSSSSSSCRREHHHQQQQRRRKETKNVVGYQHFTRTNPRSDLFPIARLFIEFSVETRKRPRTDFNRAGHERVRQERRNDRECLTHA